MVRTLIQSKVGNHEVTMLTLGAGVQDPDSMRVVIKPEPHGYHGDAGALSQATQITKHGVSAAALFLGRMLFEKVRPIRGKNKTNTAKI